MKNIYIGIDPSINSTGITIQYCNDDKAINEKLFIVKPNHLTKKEKENKKINYVLYDKEDLKDIDNNIEHEHKKTDNIINLVNAIYNTVIVESDNMDPEAGIYICMEGISYGSIKTQSVMDLAGLNYLIRYKFIDNNINIDVAPPSEIKKFATGKGNATKELIIEMFKAIHPDVEATKLDDISDSYFMCEYSKYIARSV